MSRLPPAVPSTRSQTLSGATERMAGRSDTASSLMELVLTLPARVHPAQKGLETSFPVQPVTGSFYSMWSPHTVEGTDRK